MYKKHLKLVAKENINYSCHCLRSDLTTYITETESEERGIMVMTGCKTTLMVKF
jgi:predicted SprT family Zn-dependent metalloprotease